MDGPGDKVRRTNDETSPNRVFAVLLGMIVIFVALSVSGAFNVVESARADTFRFANIYGDHMVLQMEPLVAAVWGFGQIGDPVTLMLDKEVYHTKVSAGQYLRYRWVSIPTPEFVI